MSSKMFLENGLELGIAIWELIWKTEERFLINVENKWLITSLSFWSQTYLCPN